MARTAGRSADETRRLILDAAAKLIARRGAAVPISDIARAAGVSKGGLLYHFPSKESLLNGLVVSLIEEFRTDVERRADDEPEGAPGRLTRAYIRASFALGRDAAGLRDYVALSAQLMFEPGLAEVVQRDADAWRDALHADGLDPAVVRVVVAASDGGSAASLWGAVLNETDMRGLEDQLLELTRVPPRGESAPGASG